MQKMRDHAKAVVKQNYYMYREWVRAKCKESRIELRVIERFDQSSKVRSCCGTKKGKQSLSERTFTLKLVV